MNFITRILFSKHQEERKKRIAIHESGHILISYLYYGIKDIKFATVHKCISSNYINNGSVYRESKEIISKYDYETEAQICYGGMAAEEILLGSIDIGSYGDKETAIKNITEYLIVENKYSNTMCEYTRSEKLTEIYDKTKMLLEVNQDILERLYVLLYSNNILLREHIYDIINSKPLKITLRDKIYMLYYLFFYYNDKNNNILSRIFKSILVGIGTGIVLLLCIPRSTIVK
jgi:ATP-dependent Zn protease